MNSSMVAIIGDRDKGKTTYLWNKYINAIDRGKRILIIDSATEHVDKSLIMKIQKYDSSSVLIAQCEKNEIVFPVIGGNTYPVEMIVANQRVYLCDVSYYLEKGYDYPEGKQRENCRKIYKYYAMQVVDVLMNHIDVFIFDEVELMPEFRKLICQMKNKKKELYMSLHKDDSLADLKDLFSIERI